MKLSIVPLFFLLLLASCKKEEGASTYLSIELEKGHPFIEGKEKLLLKTYGQTSVTAQSLLAGKENIIPFSRDTIDCFIICDTLGKILLPFIPDLTDATISLNRKGLHLEGVDTPELLQKWFQLKKDTLQYTALEELLEETADRPIGLLFARAAQQHFKDDTEITEHLRKAIRLNLGFATLLGLQKFSSSYPYTNQQTFPKEILFSDQKKKSLHKILKKDTALIVAFLTQRDSTEREKDSIFLRTLDSLSTTRYFLFYQEDTLPTSFQKYKKKSKRSYFLTDSLGSVSLEVERLKLDTLPLYLIVDSLGNIQHQYKSEQGLLDHLRQERKKNPKKRDTKKRHTL